VQSLQSNESDNVKLYSKHYTEAVKIYVEKYKRNAIVKGLYVQKRQPA